MNRLRFSPSSTQLVEATPSLTGAMRLPLRWLLLGLLSAGLLAGATGCSKKARLERHLTRANAYFKAEQYEPAEKEYQLVFRLDPQSKTVCSQLGLLYFAQGKWLQAFNWLRYAAGVDPENTQVRLKLARLLFTSQVSTEARKLALEVLQKQPTNEEALLLLGDLASTNDLPALTKGLEALPPAAKGAHAWHVARGRLWLAANQPDKAEAEFKQAAALAPKSSDVFLALADLHLLRQDRKQAEPALKTAAELAPWRSQTRLRYAQFQLQTGAVAEAKQGLDLVLKQVPDFLPARVLLGQVAQAERNLAEWQNLANDIVTRDPANYDGLLLKGDFMLANSDGTNAVAHFEQMCTLYQAPPVRCRLAAAYELVQDTTKAVASLNQALAVDTNNVQATLMLANIRIRNNDLSAALDSLNGLIKRNPRVPQAYQLLAQAYLQQNNLDLAVAECRRMLTLWPDNPGVLTLLGSYLSLQKRFPEARQALEKALTLLPGLPPALEKLVDIDLDEGRYSAAVERMKKQVAAAPADAGTWLLLAKVYFEKAFAACTQGRAVSTGASVTLVPAALPDATEAEKALLKTIELKPDLGGAYLLLTRLDVALKRPQQALERLAAYTAKFSDPEALMQMAVLQETLGKYEAAAATYGKLLTFNPKHVVALNNLASLYADQLGQVDKAYPLAEQAQRLSPATPGIADTFGWVLYKKGDYARALTLLQESSPKLPGETKAQFHLGLTLYMLGQDEPARLALQRAVQAGQDSPEAKEAQRRLAILAITPKTADATALAALEKCIAESPNDIVAQSRLAAIYERDGAVEKALKSYEVILRANPKNVAVLAKLSRLYAAQGTNRPKALELARQAHNLAPEDAEISRTLAHLSLEQKTDYKWVLSLLQEAAAKLPNQPDLLFDLGRCYYGVGRIADAEATMQAALKTGPFPEADKARLFLAFMAAAKDPAQASALAGQADQALKTDPDFIPALMVSGIVARQQGQAQEAKALLEKVYTLNPLFVPAARDLALLYAGQLKDDSRAYELALKAREVYPNDAPLAKALGTVCYRRGDNAGATRFLQEALAKGKEDAEVQFYLGMAQYRLQARRESKQALERALALNLGADLAPEARRVLAEMK